MNDETDHDTGIPHNPDVKERGDLKFPVVGLGASAGGLAAVKTFLENMPRTSGMAFVVILHLSPKHESVADKVLQTSTRMPVVQVNEPVSLEPNHVYVISPDTDLQMTDGCLRVATAERPRGHHVAIDLFFRTLADAHQDKAVGIVLSGTGADGSVGIARIKEQGGVTFVQAPGDAEYEDMPRNAIASEQIDFVLPVSEIPNKLVEWWGNARQIELPDIRVDGEARRLTKTPPDTGEEAERALREILEVLAARSGHDFRHYKRATVLRRIERRMQVNLLKDLPAYREFLRANTDETGALLDDMLIGVTNFFRDRESFEALERDVVPDLFQATRHPEQVRVWVPGCATGEEAYSIAMLLADHADTLSAPPQYQVFASDIDEAAIAYGRAAIYPESIITDVPPSRLRQFFSKENHRYRISKQIRDRVLFALHNVLRDPPFSRIDLISCRNLLIYLDREVQARLLEMFHFALRPGGTLFLGSSESADAAGNYFETVDKHHRIYRARALARGIRAMTMLPVRAATQIEPQPLRRQRERRGFSFADVHQRVLEFYAPPSVIVDLDSNIVHMSEHAGRYLHFAGGEPTSNLIAVVDQGLRTELRTALFQAMHGNKSVDARVKLQREDDKPPRYVNIVARPFRDPEAGADFVLVLFDEVEDTLGIDLETVAKSHDDNALVTHLEEELEATRGRLQTTIEQYETSNEELKASNEELRSASEELETSKEELQSVNEELTTVNYELKSKVEETAKINDDLQNFIGSTDIATVFVDPGLRIKRFTPRITDIFNIIPGDIGRSLLDITNRLDYPSLAEDATAAFESLRLVEREVRSDNGRSYVVRVLPYRTAENRIDGAVLTFIDTTTLRRAQERIHFSEDQLRIAAETSRDHAIVVLDEAGIVTGWNSGAEKLFGWSGEEITGESFQRLFTQEDIDAGAPQDELARAAKEGHIEEARWHQTRRGERVFCSGVLSRIDHDQFHGFVKIVRDATVIELGRANGDTRVRSNSELRSEVEAASALKDDFLAVISHELKNPLNLISVNVELLARIAATQNVPQMNNALDMIRRAVRGQNKIIDDLLDVSRIRTGKLVLNVEAVDLGALATGIVDTVQRDSMANGLEVACETPEQPVIARADPARTEQIVWNLLSNAVKFTPRGGRIKLTVDSDENCGRLVVADTGQGVEAHYLAHIFEMFGQAPSRALSGRGGLGIGLMLVKQLTERQGGRVDVHSEGLGKGSVFSVWLPLYNQDAFLPKPAEAPTRSSEASWQGMKVLLADDATQARDAVAQLLEFRGAEVRTACDGAEALAMVEAGGFDIVFADIGMPNMDGYEFAQRVREFPGGDRIPLVAVTGFTRPQDVQRAMQAGFDAHVGKPLLVRTLTDALQTVMAKRGRGERAEPETTGG